MLGKRQKTLDIFLPRSLEDNRQSTIDKLIIIIISFLPTYRV